MAQPQPPAVTGIMTARVPIDYNIKRLAEKLSMFTLTISNDHEQDTPSTVNNRTTAAASLSSLPLEVICMIAKLVFDRDLLNMRSTCRQLSRGTEREVGQRLFSSRAHVNTIASLECLARIADHEAFGTKLQEINIRVIPEGDRSVMDDKVWDSPTTMQRLAGVLLTDGTRSLSHAQWLAETWQTLSKLRLGLLVSTLITLRTKGISPSISISHYQKPQQKGFSLDSGSTTDAPNEAHRDRTQVVESTMRQATELVVSAVVKAKLPVSELHLYDGAHSEGANMNLSTIHKLQLSKSSLWANITTLSLKIDSEGLRNNTSASQSPGTESLHFLWLTSLVGWVEHCTKVRRLNLLSFDHTKHQVFPELYTRLMSALFTPKLQDFELHGVAYEDANSLLFLLCAMRVDLQGLTLKDVCIATRRAWFEFLLYTVNEMELQQLVLRDLKVWSAAGTCHTLMTEHSQPRQGQNTVKASLEQFLDALLSI